MDDANAFLATVMPRLTEVDTALHNGDAGPRKELWSRNNPVTLFGAAMTKIGRDEVAPAFDLLASRFSNCTSFECEVAASGASGDLAYIVGIEHTTASIGGADPLPYVLRVTTILGARAASGRSFTGTATTCRKATVTRTASGSAASEVQTAPLLRSPASRSGCPLEFNALQERCYSRGGRR